MTYFNTDNLMTVVVVIVIFWGGGLLLSCLKQISEEVAYTFSETSKKMYKCIFEITVFLILKYMNVKMLVFVVYLMTSNN